MKYAELVSLGVAGASLFFGTFVGADWILSGGGNPMALTAWTLAALLIGVSFGLCLGKVSLQEQAKELAKLQTENATLRANAAKSTKPELSYSDAQHLKEDIASSVSPISIEYIENLK